MAKESVIIIPDKEEKDLHHIAEVQALVDFAASFMKDGNAILSAELRGPLSKLYKSIDLLLDM